MKAPATGSNYLDRLGDAIELLCLGRRPTNKMMRDWLTSDSEDLQEFCADNSSEWMMGISVIEAAEVLAYSPTEGDNHQTYEQFIAKLYGSRPVKNSP